MRSVACCTRMLCRLSRLERDVLSTAGCLSIPECLENGGDVVVVLPRDLVANGPYLLDDRILNHVASWMASSSGVQITGGTTPAFRQTCSIFGRITAFAIWVQFHVIRKLRP